MGEKKVVVTKKLASWLNIKGWTARELSKAVGCHESDVSRWMSGERHPTWGQLVKICDLSGLDVGDIICVK